MQIHQNSFFRVFLAFFTVLSVFTGALANSDDIDKLIQKAEQRRIAMAKMMEKSTVLILSSGEDESGSGTGFVVGDGYVLTNEHVVEGGKDFYIGGKDFSLVKAELLGKVNDQRGDFALLKFTPPVKLPILSFNFTIGRTDRVSAWGFPYVYIQFDKTTTDLLEDDGTAIPPVIYTEGSVNALIDTPDMGRNILHSANIASGNSGGPLINTRGHVVGVNTWGSTDKGEGSHVNAALTAKMAVTFLRSLGMEPSIVAADGTLTASQMNESASRPSLDSSSNSSSNSSGGWFGTPESPATPKTAGSPSADDLTGEAKSSYAKAAGGDADAQSYIGFAYWEGEDAPENVDKAVYWLKKATDQGHAGAKALLGIIYIVEPDFKNVQKGLEFLKDAAKNDNDAAAVLAMFLFYGETLGIKRDAEGAFAAAQKGAEAKDMDAIALLALLYYTGDGVEADSKRAHELALQAEKEGNALAYAVLSWMYYIGDFLEEDNAKAFEYAKKAAEDDDILGTSLLSAFYYQGDGVEQDFKLAHKYAEEASDSFGEVGQYIMGMLYANGQGVTKDPIKAWAYFDMANRQNVEDAQEQRDALGEKMSEKELKDAKSLVRQWYSQSGLDIE